MRGGAYAIDRRPTARDDKVFPPIEVLWSQFDSSSAVSRQGANMKAPSRSASINAAIAYASLWVQLQMERYRQVGCAIAISDGAKLIHEEAFGSPILRRRKP
jgi:hypothetical protein